jgi:ribonuclease P protein component
LLNKLKLDKSNIIKNRSEFSHAIRDGLIYKGKFFLIAVVANTQLRYGFTTKSGLSKPDRNRLKRLARELWRIWQSGYDLHGDCIVITREQALKASFKMLESDFRALLGLLEKSRQAGQL